MSFLTNVIKAILVSQIHLRCQFNTKKKNSKITEELPPLYIRNFTKGFLYLFTPLGGKKFKNKNEVQYKWIIKIIKKLRTFHHSG